MNSGFSFHRTCLAAILWAQASLSSLALAQEPAPAPPVKSLPAPIHSQEFKPEAVLAVLEKVAEHQMASQKMASQSPLFATGWEAFCAVSGNEKYAAYIPKEKAKCFWNPEDYSDAHCISGDATEKWSAQKLAGLAQFIQGMKPSDPARKNCIEVFAEGVDAIRATQGEEGLWRAGLQKPKANLPVDAGTSALAAYALAFGVNQSVKMHWLDSSRLKVIRAWRGLVCCVAADGSLLPGGGTAEMEGEAVGAFLLAGAEVYRMAKEMTEFLPFVVSKEYQADLVYQKTKIAGEPQPTVERTLTTMRKVCEWQQGNLFKGTPGKVVGDAQAPDRSWFRGALMAGVVSAARATQDDYYWKLAQKIAEENQWQPGPNVLHDGNDFAITQTYLALYLDKEKDPKRIGSTRAAMDALMAKGEAGRREWSWADALFMAPAAWAQMSAATGDPRYRDRMNRLWWDSIEYLKDKETRLFYRDGTYMPQPDGFQIRERNGKKVFWGRGNGWVTGGLCNVLEALPKDYPERPKYEKLLAELCAALAATQGGDGLWRASLLDPESYPLGETSGSTFFCYGIAWAINHGIVDREKYLPVVQKAWHGLMACVEEDGKLGYVQLPADSPRSPTYRSKNVEYAAGAFLSAGAEMIKLLERSPKAGADAIEPGQSILPACATAQEPISVKDHPFAKEIQSCLKLQESEKAFQPTGLSRKDYLRIVSGQVHAFRKYVDEKGELHDPVAARSFYSAPHYAHCVATLAAAGVEKDPDIIESGMRSLDYSLERLQLSPEEKLAQGLGAQPHSDFFIYPAVQAFEQFAKIAPKERVQKWEALLRRMKPTTFDLYKNYGNNWSLVHGAGEFLRATHGFTDLGYVEEILDHQKMRRTPQGLFMEGGAPLAYDTFARYFVTGMLQRGYHGEHFEFMRDWMWQGAWTGLLIQSPFGEMPTGYRSAHHIWNEAEMAKIFEIYAAQYARAGRLAEAGAFKRGAHLALHALSGWIRPDGSGYIVKNRYPIEAQHAYHGYSTHTNYNMLAMSMLCAAYTYADENVAEKPAPADVGGFFIRLNGFNVAVANCAGNYVEYMLRGNFMYNPSGILRVHLKGSNPQVGPSDGVMGEWGGKHNTIAYGLGPAWIDADGTETRLAEFPEASYFSPSELRMDEKPMVQIEPVSISPAKVVIRAVTSWEKKAAKVTETLTLTPEGLRVENVVNAPGVKSMRLYFPLLVSDGQEETKTTLDGARLSVALRGSGETFRVIAPASVKLQRLGKQFLHWNGMMEPVYADIPALQATYTLTADK